MTDIVGYSLYAAAMGVGTIPDTRKRSRCRLRALVCMDLAQQRAFWTAILLHFDALTELQRGRGRENIDCSSGSRARVTAFQLVSY